jgi:ribosomal protein L36
MQNKKKKFDAESSDYDYESAKKYGIKQDSTGHCQSRLPETGLLLKGAKHKTWKLTLEGEKKMGCKVIKKNGRYYSICPDDSLKKK